MPRFAFALPLVAESIDEWRQAAHALTTTLAKDHRAFLLSRGIFRERVWLQHGIDAPLTTLVLWDCDDIEVATAMRTDEEADPHERSVARTMLGRHHGQDASTFVFPLPEVLNGRTVRPTAASAAQTMFGIPVPPGRVPQMRDLMRRADGGDLDEGHRQLLEGSGVHEEWTWLQPAAMGLPDMILLHWIGEDLVLSWKRMLTFKGNSYLDALLSVLSTRTPQQRTVELDWQVEQVIAMHVRRSDAGDEPTRRLAGRLGAALSRGRWDLVADALDPAAIDADALGAVRGQLGDGDLVVTDTLISDTQILATLADRDLAVLFGLDHGVVTSVRVLTDHG